MRDKIAWIGVLIVALGLVIPWATYSGTLAGRHFGGGTIAGYEYLQSLLAVGISVVGVLVSLKLSRPLKKLTLIAAGAIVLIVAGSALADLSQPARVITPPSSEIQLPSNAPREIREAQARFRRSQPTMRISYSPHAGIFVTMLGGILIGIGGFIDPMANTDP